jgi:hypothetical protein
VLTEFDDRRLGNFKSPKPNMTPNQPAATESRAEKLVPAVRLSSREVEGLIQQQYQHAKITRLHQVG